MNALAGVWRLDAKPVNPAEISACLFQSPRWQPDHQTIFISGSFGLACRQRFITSECSRAPMPYQDPKSGCVIAGDLYLTDRKNLAGKLDCSTTLPDIEFALLAYRKWGENCARHLCGSFMFAVWDPARHKLFVTTDHFGTHPCLYAHRKGRYFIFSNSFGSFRKLCPDLTLAPELFLYFSLDSLPDEDTCYREIKKIPAAHSLTVTPESIRKQRYWKFPYGRKNTGCRTREDYYRAFREVFEETIRSYMRTPFPVLAHISGGLDSSSVAAMAAQILKKENKILTGFTDIPGDLKERSLRPSWVSHELPLVETLLKQYPNIRHHTYCLRAEIDPFEILEPFYPEVDQPFRNVTNLEWILASLEQAAANGGRLVLNGQAGNASISWPGQSTKDILYSFYRDVQDRLKPHPMVHSYFENHNPSLLKTKKAKKILHFPLFTFNLQHWMLKHTPRAARQTSLRPLVLYYGVEYLDPLRDLRLAEFCMNVPEWVYTRANAPLQRRLLAREGLKGIVPEAILQNPNRGEQSADWPLQFNRHYPKWRAELESLPGDSVLWEFYDRKKILGLFGPVDELTLTPATQLQIQNNLMRLISLASFWNYLQRN